MIFAAFSYATVGRKQSERTVYATLRKDEVQSQAFYLAPSMAHRSFQRFQFRPGRCSFSTRNFVSLYFRGRRAQTRVLLLETTFSKGLPYVRIVHFYRCKL